MITELCQFFVKFDLKMTFIGLEIFPNVLQIFKPNY